MRIDELTAFEEDRAERAAGMSLASLEDEDAPKVAMLGALAWVHRKRAEPTLTYEAFMKSTSGNKIAAYLYSDPEDEAAAKEVERAETAAVEHRDVDPDAVDLDGNPISLDVLPGGAEAGGAGFPADPFGAAGRAGGAEGPVLPRDASTAV